LTPYISKNRQEHLSIFMPFSINLRTQNWKMTWKLEPEMAIGAILRKNRIFGCFFWGGLNLNIFQCFSFRRKWLIFGMMIADMCAYKMPQKVYSKVHVTRCIIF